MNIPKKMPNLRRKVVRKYTFSCLFGQEVFKSVPVMVRGVKASFNQERDEHFIPIEWAIVMEREVAKKWLRSKYKEEAPELSASEVGAILSLVGVKSTVMAELVKVSKSKLSKVLSGAQVLSAAAVSNCLLLLDYELAFPGEAQKGNYQVLFSSEPEFDMAKRA